MRISERDLQERLLGYGQVMAMWDIHSKDRILIEDYWKFGKNSVIAVDAANLIQGLEFLPEDLYLFDERLKWTLILTHEWDRKRRICFEVGI